MIVETLRDDGSHAECVVVGEEGEIRDDRFRIVNEGGKVIHVEAPERVGIHGDVWLLLVARRVVVMRRRGVVRRWRFVAARISLRRRIRLRGIATAPRRWVLTVSRHAPVGRKQERELISKSPSSIFASRISPFPLRVLRSSQQVSALSQCTAPATTTSRLAHSTIRRGDGFVEMGMHQLEWSQSFEEGSEILGNVRRGGLCWKRGGNAAGMGEWILQENAFDDQRRHQDRPAQQIRVHTVTEY